MNLYIPSVGDELRLVADWHFKLWNEHRNETLMEFVKDDRKTCYGSYDREWGSIDCTIPAGAVLKVDRIYIRKGKEDFDSITFMWKGMRTDPREEPRYATPLVPGHPHYGQRVYTHSTKIPRKPVRFWAKLEDANKIEFVPA